VTEAVALGALAGVGLERSLHKSSWTPAEPACGPPGPARRVRLWARQPNGASPASRVPGARAVFPSGRRSRPQGGATLPPSPMPPEPLAVPALPPDRRAFPQVWTVLWTDEVPGRLKRR
jgi:hypothetical protein